MAAVLEATGGSLRLTELDIAGPKANEVAIRIVACDLCHSDYSCIHGIVRTPLPVVLGHEAGGIVEEVGPGVSALEVGDHVIVALTPACGRCEFCVEEKPFLCTQMFATLGNCTMPDGTTRLSRDGGAVHQLCAIGGFAERAVVPAGCTVRVDSDLALETICLIGCGVTTGVGAALNTAGIRPGTTVAVLGCGGVGLSVVQGARIAGAKTIVAVDPVAAKRELAMALGATHAVDPGVEDSTRAVRKIVPGGVHYAFEVIGRAETMAQAFAMARPSGMAIVVGVTSPGDSIPRPSWRLPTAKDAHRLGIRIGGAASRLSSLPRALSQGRPPTRADDRRAHCARRRQRRIGGDGAGRRREIGDHVRP
jgi:S-(hydroxymethyl)glutathione dehydrogenase / alcohol dehydrogenase